MTSAITPIIAEPRVAIIVGSGYSVGDGPGSGPFGLWQVMWDAYPDRRQTMLRFTTWNGDHDATVKVIDWYRPDKIIIVGHSYAIGHMAREVTAKLADIGRRVTAWMCIDPVPRYGILPAKAMSLTRMGSIVVPANVDHAWSWRTVNKPGLFNPVGHPLKAEEPAITTIHPEKVYGITAALKKYGGENDPEVRSHVYSGHTHNTIDNDPTIHAEIIGIIDGFIRGNA